MLVGTLTAGTVRETATAYGYDRLYRLTAVDSPDLDSTYAYDPVGNRLSLTRASATAYTYDGDGKRASKTVGANTTSYVYNANRSLPVVHGGGPGPRLCGDDGPGRNGYFAWQSMPLPPWPWFRNGLLGPPRYRVQP